MNRNSFTGFSLVLCIGSGCVSASAQGAPPDVTYTVSGSANDWTLDFRLKSNFVATEGVLYFFGVKLPVRDITGSPSGWDPNANNAWDNSFAGGSTTEYNNIWNASPVSAFTVAPGSALSGFVVHDTDLVAPTSVPYFTYGAAGTYNGDGFFSNRGNPGFEGSAGPSASATPEPGGIALLLTGATTTPLLFLRRRRRT